MRRFGTLTAAVLALLVTAPHPIPLAAQQASWLDGELASWNTAAMAIPAAPTVDGYPDPRCASRERPAETDEDDALIAEGWRLFLPYQRGWGVTLVSGLAGYDGMCRPLGYQYFVFVDGEFAGTIAPRPMDSRSDGAADTVSLWFADQLSAEFRRYTANDALCCPSGSTSVDYTIVHTPAGPVLNPNSAAS
jgi:hypothetical protein